MKRGVTQTFLAIAISLFIPIFQAYFHHHVLSEADFLSLDLKLETPDQEFLPIIRQDESKMVLSSNPPMILPPEIVPLEHFLGFFFTPYSLNQETVILRC